MTENVANNETPVSQTPPDRWTDTQVNEFFDNPTELPELTEPSDVPEKKESAPENADQKVSGETKEPEKSQDNEQTEEVKREEYNKQAALQEARKENRLLMKEMHELKEQNKKFNSMFEKIFNPADEKKAPSFEEDPLAALKHENDLVKKELNDLKQFKDTDIKQRQEMESQHKFLTDYRGMANQFASTNPEFNSAYDYLLKSRFDEYTTAGYQPEQATQMVREDEMAIAAHAMTNGLNPAEKLFALAKLRGFNQDSKVVEKSTNNNQAPSKNAVQKIEQIEKGLKASKSLNESGSSSSNKLTLEDIASMSDAEFDKVDWDKDVLIYG